MGEEPRGVHLNMTEYQYLQSLATTRTEVRDLVALLRLGKGEQYEADVPGDLAEAVRDVLTHELSVHGFTDSYSLTEEGTVIERLIDRLE